MNSCSSRAFYFFPNITVILFQFSLFISILVFLIYIYIYIYSLCLFSSFPSSYPPIRPFNVVLYSKMNIKGFCLYLLPSNFLVFYVIHDILLYFFLFFIPFPPSILHSSFLMCIIVSFLGFILSSLFTSFVHISIRFPSPSVCFFPYSLRCRPEFGVTWRFCRPYQNMAVTALHE
jgi:hypothetical protein